MLAERSCGQANWKRGILCDWLEVHISFIWLVIQVGNWEDNWTLLVINQVSPFGSDCLSLGLLLEITV